MRAWSTYLALVVCLGLGQQAKAYEFDEDDAAESSTWTEIAEPRKGATCLDMCLADGEELFDCEYYCIQTAKAGPLFPRTACARP
jgi:hypothetical protein